MSVDYVAGAVVAMFISVYLLYALARPEKF